MGRGGVGAVNRGCGHAMRDSFRRRVAIHAVWRRLCRRTTRTKGCPMTGIVHISSVLSFLAVASCGGGGGGGGGTPPPMNLSSAPGEAALVGYLQSSHQATLNASDNSGNTYTIQLSRVPNAGTTTFNGSAPAYSTVDTLTLDKNGVLVGNSISTGYYLLNPYVPLGSASSTGSPFGIVTSFTPFPTTLNVGSSGPVDDVTYYHDSTQTALDADEVGTYSVTANNSATLNLCLNFVVSNVSALGTNDGLADDTESDCYTVDASGNVTLDTITLSVNGVTLNFQ
jgi:hypothetical protein